MRVPILIAILLLAGSCVLGVGIASDLLGQPPADSTIAKVAIQASIDNRERFEFFKCRFIVRSFNVADREEAVKGAPGGAISCDVTWVVNGKESLFDQRVDPAIWDNALKTATDRARGDAKSGPHSHGVPYSSSSNLRTRTRRLSFARDVGFANLFSLEGRKEPEAAEYTPFTISEVGPFQLARLYQRCLDGSLSMTLEPSKRINGSETVGVTFRGEKNQAVAQYWLDSNRGYLPVLVTMFADSGDRLDYHTIEARQCSKGRWFPTWSLSVVPAQRNSKSEFFVRDIRVQELEVDRRPKEKDMQIDLPAGTRVVLQDGRDTGFRLRKEQSVGPSDLEDLFELNRRVKEQPLVDTVLPEKRPWRWYRWTAIAVGIVLVGVLTVYFVFRRGIQKV